VALPDGPKCKQPMKTFSIPRHEFSYLGNEAVLFPSNSLLLFQAPEIDGLA